ncbi:hypothetical protein SAMN05421738_1161 [Algoriella xinjiangensis]|uniref:Uncharacterized protein n=1 Tax=Algoriella xinjiangensis TaxID=684065 RepID=A0A1I5A9S6_9FLAO|nr:hypothetical protein SAMN05421738_1161 [Algoriella xinjiangensis]
MKNFFINIFLIFFGLSFNYAQDGVGINGYTNLVGSKS